VAVAYFTTQSCLHIVINCLGLPVTDQNMPYLSPYDWPVPNSAKFRENIEIPRKWANSVAWLKTACATENCGAYISAFTFLPFKYCSNNRSNREGPTVDGGHLLLSIVHKLRHSPRSDRQ